MTVRTEVTQQIRFALRQMGAQLGRLNGAVGSVVELKAIDIELVDHIGRVGPISPSELASSLGIHPATLTGIIDRLESGGWLLREPAAEDRRRVKLRALRTRAPELVRLYSPMNDAITELCEGLSDKELATIRDFLIAIGDAATRARQQVTEQADQPRK